MLPMLLLSILLTKPNPNVTCNEIYMCGYTADGPVFCERQVACDFIVSPREENADSPLMLKRNMGD